MEEFFDEQKKSSILVWLIIGLTVVVHIIVFLYTLNNPNRLTLRDSFEYLHAADNLRTKSVLYSGDLLESPEPELYSRRPPLYSLLIAILQTVWHSHFLITLFQVGLNFLNVWLIWKILIAMEIRSVVRHIAIVIYLLYPAQIIYSHLIMTEILFQTLLFAAIFSLFQYARSKRILFLLILNLSVSLSVLTKPVLLFFWIPNLAFHAWLFWRHRRPAILALPLIFVATLLLWSYRNYERTGYFHNSSIKNHNLLYFNTHSLITKMSGEAHADSFVANVEREIEGMSFAAANKRIEQVCFEKIKNHWPNYGFHHLLGTAFFFLDPGRFDIYIFMDIQGPHGLLSKLRQSGLAGFPKLIGDIPISVLIYIAVVGIINLFFLILFVLCFFLRTDFIEFKVFLLLTVLYVAAATGPIGMSRFRLAIFPYLLMTLPLTLGSSKRMFRIFKKDSA